MPRVRGVQIYLKPGVPDDDQMLAVWDACMALDRPQVVFRQMLRHGLRRMAETGELPPAVMKSAGIDIPAPVPSPPPAPQAPPVRPVAPEPSPNVVTPAPPSPPSSGTTDPEDAPKTTSGRRLGRLM
jgi:hypothetical protein